MVDRDARDRYVDVINRYLAGETNNHGYHAETEDLRGSEDAAINGAYAVLWGTYDDILTHDANQSGPEAVEALKRAAAFLRTDLAYSWPPLASDVKFGLSIALALSGLVVAALAAYGSSIVGAVIGVGLLVLAAVDVRRNIRLARANAPDIDWDVWPFADGEQMRQHCPVVLEPHKE